MAQVYSEESGLESFTLKVFDTLDSLKHSILQTLSAHLEEVPYSLGIPSH